MTAPHKEMTREEILEALKNRPPGGDYVWDGVDEDDRPATAEELRAGIEEARRREGLKTHLQG